MAVFTAELEVAAEAESVLLADARPPPRAAMRRPTTTPIEVPFVRDELLARDMSGNQFDGEGS